MKMLPKDDRLSTREVADLRAVSVRVVQKAVRRGELIPIEKGRGRNPHLFRRSDVDAWIPRCERPRNRYSDEELLGWLRQAEGLLGHVPTTEEMTSLGQPFPPTSTFIRRYGSWRAAVRLATGRFDEESDE